MWTLCLRVWLITGDEAAGHLTRLAEASGIRSIQHRNHQKGSAEEHQQHSGWTKRAVAEATREWETQEIHRSVLIPFVALPGSLFPLSASSLLSDSFLPRR